jgi:hypothetical protein
VRDQIQSAYGDRVLTGRSPAEIAALFGDFELVPPGIVPVTDWPLDSAGPSQPPLLRQVPSAPTKARMLAGIGRKRA